MRSLCTFRAQGLNSLQSTMLATLLLVCTCLGAGIVAIGLIYAGQKAIDRWSTKTQPGINRSDGANEMACISKGATGLFPPSNSESAVERRGCDGNGNGNGNGGGDGHSLRDGDLMVVAISRLREERR